MPGISTHAEVGTEATTTWRRTNTSVLEAAPTYTIANRISSFLYERGSIRPGVCWRAVAGKGGMSWWTRDCVCRISIDISRFSNQQFERVTVPSAPSSASNISQTCISRFGSVETTVTIPPRGSLALGLNVGLSAINFRKPLFPPHPRPLSIGLFPSSVRSPVVLWGRGWPREGS
jgi:hypothetical protein